MGDIRLVAIDLDGTLLNSNHEVSKEDLAAIRLAAQKGVLVAIASGRIYSTVKPLSHSIMAGMPYLSSNGAVMGFNDRADFLSALFVEDTLALEILDCAVAHGCEVHAHTMDGSMAHLDASRKTHIPQKSHEKFGAFGAVNLLFDYDGLKRHIKGQTLKFVISNADESAIDRVRGELSPKPVFIASSWRNNIEVMAPGADKGSGLKRLAGLLGIPLHQTMALGDNENDEAMFLTAGFPVAMANATDRIKSISRAVTLDCDHAGVANAIHTYVL